jgi:putative membrane protein
MHARVTPSTWRRTVRLLHSRATVRGASIVTMLAVIASVARAHDGQPLAPHDLARAWSFEPMEWLGLALSLWAYVRGTRRLWRRGGVGRGIRVWESVAFIAGWTTTAIALISPLHALGGVLFSAHMAQHQLLMLVAAPLLVLGRPIVPMLWALPVGSRRRVGSVARSRGARWAWAVLSGTGVAFALHAVAIWLLHAPGIYQLAMRSDAVHSVQHLGFFGTALLFWWSVLHRGARRANVGPAIAALFGTALHTGALGALITFASSLWYPAYAATTAPWGLMPIEDQQLAGLMMWIPGSAAYTLAALWLVAGRLSDRAHGTQLVTR